MKAIAIIPARYASTRFPGKPLALLGGRPVIQHVYTRVAEALGENVIVATDDTRIFEAVEAFGGRAVMTSPDHCSGTDRCHEAYVKSGSDADIVINVQGDEPFIAPSQVLALRDCFADEDVDIATLVRSSADGNVSESDLFDPNKPKVVIDDMMNALYFSRQAIPYVRGAEPSEWLGRHVYYTHVGIYAFRAEVLARVVDLPRSPLEVAESLEQLRWLQAGYRIRTAVTGCNTIGIDTPEDLRNAELFLNK